MMQNRLRLFALMVVLLAVGLACGLEGDVEQNTNIPVLSSDVVGNPNNDQGAGQDQGSVQEQGSEAGEQSLPLGPEVLNLDDPEAVKTLLDTSFTMQMSYSFNSETISESFEINGVYNPGSSAEAGYTVVFDSSEGVSTMAIADLADINYVYVPGVGCMQYSEEELAALYDDLLLANDDLTGTAPRVDTGVEINGVLTDRYILTPENFSGMGMEGVTFEKGELYLSRDGYVIYLEVVGSGSNVFGETTATGTFTFMFSARPAGETVTINVLEGCAGQ